MRVLFIIGLFCSTFAQAEWFPVSVTADGRAALYSPLSKASKAWRICALLPQGKDRFWWSVSWGLSQEAARQGIKLGIYQAGGYEHTEKQQAQFDTCLALKANAIIVAAIDSEALGSRVAIAEQRNIPVIDLSNGLNLPKISAHVLSNTAQMAQMAAKYILSSAGNRRPTVAWLPGPAKSEWVINAEQEVNNILAAPQAQLIHGGYGATDLNTQMTLVRTLLSKYQPDYLLANAVAADAASRLIKYESKRSTKIVAYYSNEETLAALRQGTIEAAIANSPTTEGRISIDVAIRILENRPYSRMIYPEHILLTPEQVKTRDLSPILAPAQQWFIAKPLPK
jgi:protein TorT